MRAGGEKVRDEEKALLKAAKRIDKEKQKGRKEWSVLFRMACNSS